MEARYTEGIQISPDLQSVTLRTVCPEGWLDWYEDEKFHTAPLTFRLCSDGSYCADFSLPEEGTVYSYVLWENIPTSPDTVTLYNYSITCAHRLFLWHHPYQLPSDVLAANRFDSGWSSKSWGFEGQLAPEGKYDVSYTKSTMT